MPTVISLVYYDIVHGLLFGLLPQSRTAAWQNSERKVEIVWAREKNGC